MKLIIRVLFSAWLWLLMSRTHQYKWIFLGWNLRLLHSVLCSKPSGSWYEVHLNPTTSLGSKFGLERNFSWCSIKMEFCFLISFVVSFCQEAQSGSQLVATWNWLNQNSDFRFLMSLLLFPRQRHKSTCPFSVYHLDKGLVTGMAWWQTVTWMWCCASLSLYNLQ